MTKTKNPIERPSREQFQLLRGVRFMDPGGPPV
jgi:hypothetical protein